MYQSLRSEEFTANNVTDVKSALLTVETNRYDMLIARLQVMERRLSITTSSTITEKVIELSCKEFRWTLTEQGEL